jgi:hypothetical protein
MSPFKDLSINQSEQVPKAQFHRLNAVPEHFPFTRAYLRKAVFQKRIPFHRVGRCIYFKESDLLALLEAGRVEPAKTIGIV